MPRQTQSKKVGPSRQAIKYWGDAFISRGAICGRTGKIAVLP